MGGNMAARYLAAGYTVYGEDRDRASARWLVDQDFAGPTRRARSLSRLMSS
jgi:3-hydroxyisobutyrate dehydrogenase-like beta-hydroxyacid dehydrogenase